jgi:DNA invertase Pin-like site-specific DNA recombinase
MDRLTRSLSLLESLKLSGVKFTMADMPMVTEAIVPILMAIGSYEREILRTRTREALAALKAKGVALGSSRSGHWTGREALRLAGQAKATKKAVTARRQKMIERYGDLQPRIVKMRTDGMTYAAIAETLNAETREFLSEAEMTGAVRFDVMKVRRISNMVMAA